MALENLFHEKSISIEGIMNLIRGSGGGGKGGGGASFSMKEESDSLQSISYAQVLDVVSEGEIGGLVDGLHSVFLDGTPVVDSDGNLNFKGVFIESRNGTQIQTAIPGFPSAENEVSIGVEVEQATPVVRSIANFADAINVRIGIPQLTVTDTSNGELKGGSVQFAIEVNTNGGGWVQKANDTIIGKCVSKYQKSYRIELGVGSHQVRVRRITADSVSSAVVNKIFWDSYGQVVDSKLKYPNTALMGVRVDASNFSSIPTRAYEIKGIKIKVPSNYDPESRVYTGIWDGTFIVAWSNNPAWVFYDLATNTRYGAAIPESQVDKWGLYTVAKYCDQLVDDGFGNKTPRFTTNCYFQSREEAFNLLRDLSNRFRGMFYFQGGLLSVSQDAPTDPAFLFNRSNVIDGRFTYQGTAKANRYTVVLVTWNDPENQYRPTVEYVSDDDAVAKYGVIQKEITALGCTNRAEAHRLGKWEIYVSQYETETVTFKIAAEGAKLRLGHIIKVQDPVRAGSRLGGRVKTGALGSIIVDADLTLDLVNESYTVLVTLPSGVVESRIVTGYSAREISWGTNLSEVPHNYATWILASNSIEPQTFRVVSITETENGYNVMALSHRTEKYDYIESNLSLENRNITSISIVPDIPTGLKVTENLYESGGEIRNKATFSWEAKARAAGYQVFYKTESGNTVSTGTVASNEVEILNLDEAVYEFTVYAVSALGVRSAKASIQYEILGKKIAPENVQDFSLMPLSDYAQLTWKKTTSLDVLIGGRIRIRHTPDIASLAEWKNAVDVALLPGNATQAQVPLLSGTYMAKFIDSTGNVSESETLIYTNIPEARKVNVVATLNENPTFNGSKVNMLYSDQYGGLVLTGTQNIDDVADFDSLDTIDFSGGVSAMGSYEFENKVDVGGLYSCKVTLNLKVEAFDVYDKIDSREGLIDTWGDIDGNNLETVNAQAFMATTEDDPANLSAVWTEWKPFFVGEYKARGFKFKIEATSEVENHSIVVKELSVVVDMPDRSESSNNINSLGSGFLTISYEKAFKAVPALMITAKSLSAGERPVITNETTNGFDIKFVDSGGANVVRSFDYVSIGYGRKI